MREARAFARAVETCTLQSHGNVLTTLRFDKSATDTSVKQIHSIACVRPGTGGTMWGMRVFWPINPTTAR